MPSYANNGNVNFPFDLLKSQFPNVKIIRIEITPSLVSLSTIQSWITQISNAGYTVIRTYHDFLGSNSGTDLETAATWWKNNYNIISNTNNPLIINICNEWGNHDISYNDYASSYNNAIKIIRQVYSNYLIIDIPGWGQEFQIASLASSLITDNNIIFSAHIYPQGWNQYESRNILPQDIDFLLNTGRPVLIGEFGIGEGNTNVPSIVNYAKSKNINILLWGTGDGSQPPYNMELINPSWYTDPLTTIRQATTYFITMYNEYL